MMKIGERLGVRFAVQRGDLYLADLGGAQDSVGCEQYGIRPVVVVSNDIGNGVCPTIIVALVTSRSKRPLPTHQTVRVKGLESESTILYEQLRTIDRARLIRRIGALDRTQSKEGIIILKQALGMIPL